MFKNFIISGNKYRNKNGEYIFPFKFRWSRVIRTKDPIRTLNRLGDLFYFTPQYLLEKGLINKLELLIVSGLRHKYGRVKVCLLELK